MAAEVPAAPGRAGRPWSVDLGPGVEPDVAVRRLAERVARPAALWGRWFGGGALLFGDPVEVVRAERAEELFRRLDGQPALDPAPDSDGLIGGGWLVSLGYASGASWAGFCDWLLRRHPGGRWAFETLGLAGRATAVEAALSLGRAVLAADGPPARAGPGTVGLFRGPDAAAEERHLAAAEQAVGMIHRGEVYQLNLCTRLRASTTRRPVDLFADVVGRLRPSYGGLLSVGDRQALVSCSPELFLTEHDGVVVTAPIKGTTASAADPTGALLAASTKDAAENVMITDLMRNDLSRVCVPGTVMVSDLLGLHRHPGVWHLVSTVTGRLAAGTPRSDLLTATFPPGSVTGAPKSTAVAGIAELEATSRGAYTGAYGLLTPTAGMELSVTIRSFETDADGIELGVGGGITVDSVGVREWDECLHKAAPLVAAAGGTLDPALHRSVPTTPAPVVAAGLIETLLAVNGRVLRLAAHLARLDRSCRELYGAEAPVDLGRQVRAAAGPTSGRTGVRVRVWPAGVGLRSSVETWRLSPRMRSCRLVAGGRPEWSWRHKWADRAALSDADQASAPALPYFTGPEGHVAETSRGNLFIRRAGRWVTPPADEHLLPGVTRRDVLDLLHDLGTPAVLQRFGADALRRADAAFWTSSLSGAVTVLAVDGRPLGAADDVVAELNDRLEVEAGVTPSPRHRRPGVA